MFPAEKEARAADELENHAKEKVQANAHSVASSGENRMRQL